MIEDNFRIQAECADCKFLFDATKGLDCPRCRSAHIAWARRITDEEYARERNALFGDYAERLLRKKMDEFVERHIHDHKVELRFNPYEHRYYRVAELGNLIPVNGVTEGDRLDIEELERMYALQEEPNATRLPKP